MVTGKARCSQQEEGTQDFQQLPSGRDGRQCVAAENITQSVWCKINNRGRTVVQSIDLDWVQH